MRTITYCNRNYSMTNGVTFEFGADKKIPSVLTEYADGQKHLILITGASTFSFEHEDLRFNIVEYMFNQKLNRWDETNSGAFTNNNIMVNNSFYTDTNSGLNEEEIYDITQVLDENLMPIVTKTLKQSYIDAHPNVTPNLVPNFILWKGQLGTHILGALAGSAKRFIDRKFPDVE